MGADIFPRMSIPPRSSAPMTFDATRPDRRASFSILVSSMPCNMASRCRSETVDPLGRSPFHP
jgi:hypothetical protein